MLCCVVNGCQATHIGFHWLRGMSGRINSWYQKSTQELIFCKNVELKPQTQQAHCVAVFLKVLKVIQNLGFVNILIEKQIYKPIK